MGHTLPSNLLASLLTSVEINGIAIPLKSSLNALQRFCRPLLFQRDDCGAFELSYSGSCLFFRSRGRLFAMCCKHQTEKDQVRMDPADICLIKQDGGKNLGIRPKDYFRAQLNNLILKADEDILLVEYESEQSDLSSFFLEIDFDATRTLSEVEPENVKLMFAIGYPSRFSDYEIHYDSSDIPVTADIVTRWAKLYLERRASNLLDPDSRIAIKIIDKYHAEIGDPDGFSGSPVFFIWQDAGRQIHLGFGGIITHGNAAGDFAMYPAETIRGLVKQILDQPNRRVPSNSGATKD